SNSKCVFCSTTVPQLFKPEDLVSVQGGAPNLYLLTYHSGYHGDEKARFNRLTYSSSCRLLADV
ncbi:hypothetical protein BgiMline_018524, partial [Biomphalaria glabrata]